MDKFARLPPEEQQQYFLLAESKTPFNKLILEKDFWVSWVLHRLFQIDELGDLLTFKGGTSLSKCYNLIKRFSEDIDISIEKSVFGFEGNRDPENEPSPKGRNLLLKELSNACKKYVANDLFQLIETDFSKVLGENNSWNIEVDSTDSSGQTIIFNYPQNKDSNMLDSFYIKRSIKLEFGARSDHWPTQECLISPYISGVAELEGDSSKVRTLSPERTFWEKATILHMYAHYPEEKKVPIRQSRHYYDFFSMLENIDLKEKACDNLELLDRVSFHKRVFFRAGWASYHSAKQGSLKLIPSNKILEFMEKDFKAMSEMIYGNIPTWSSVVVSLEKFQHKFNNTK